MVMSVLEQRLTGCALRHNKPTIVNGTANLYLNGDKARKLPQHRMERFYEEKNLSQSDCPSSYN